MFPDDEALAWRLRSGLAQRIWKEQERQQAEREPEDVNAPFKESAEQIADARRKMGLEF